MLYVIQAFCVLFAYVAAGVLVQFVSIWLYKKSLQG